MGQFTDLIGHAWRKYETPGVPSSGFHDPKKDEILPIGPALDEALAAATSGKRVIDAVRVAATGNINITSPGAAIDGVGLSAGDRVALPVQSAGAQNGYWTWNGAAVPMTRTADADTGAELVGATAFVREGTVNKGKTYTVANTTAPNVGTDAINMVVTSELDQTALDSKQDASSNLDGWSQHEDVIYPAASDQSFAGWATDATGFVISPGIYTLPNGTVVAPSFSVVEGDYSIIGYSTDPTGFVIPQQSSESGGGSGSDETARFEAQDAYAVAYSAAVPLRPLPEIAGLWWDYVLFMDYGQSEDQGGASPLPKTISVPSFGISAKMVGYSTRSADESDTYYPFGSLVNANGVETIATGSFDLRDMVATSDIDKNGGGSVYDYTDWIISPIAGHNGEAPVVSWVYGLWSLINEARNEMTGNFAGRVPIGSTQGFGGKTLAQLTSTSPSGSEDFAPRLRMENFSTQLAAHIPATYAGKTVGFAAWKTMQGTADGLASTPKATYKAGLGTARTMMNDTAESAFGQIVPPAMFIVQTGIYPVAGKPDVPQAQHEFARENQDEGVWLVANKFNVPSKFQVPSSPGFTALPSTTDFSSTTVNVHLDGNATRWLSAYVAKVCEQIFWHRRNWQHMHVVKGTWRSGSRNVCVSWHCPVGPIRTLHSWQGYRKVFMPNNGIQFFQGATEIGVNSMTFMEQSIVFELDIIPTSGVPLVIHVGTARGMHNIADSDPSVSRFTYQYSHQDFAAFDPNPANMTAGELLVDAEAQAELADYINQPYPLPNYAAIEVFTLTEITE
jgi:hypothetical protein